MSGPIWGGSRVRVTVSPHPSVPVGAEGRNLGRRQGRAGAITLLIRLDDGRRVRLPLRSIEKIEDTYVPDAIAWKTDLPQTTLTRQIRTVDQATTKNFRYQLRGSTGRWFITRERLTPDRPAEIMRTPFYPNQRFAYEVFIHLTVG